MVETGWLISVLLANDTDDTTNGQVSHVDMTRPSIVPSVKVPGSQTGAQTWASPARHQQTIERPTAMGMTVTLQIMCSAW